MIQWNEEGFIGVEDELWDPHMVEERSISLGSSIFVGTRRPKRKTRPHLVKQTSMTLLTKLLDLRRFFSILKNLPKVARRGCSLETERPWRGV